MAIGTLEPPAPATPSLGIARDGSTLSGHAFTIPLPAATGSAFEQTSNPTITPSSRLLSSQKEDLPKDIPLSASKNPYVESAASLHKPLPSSPTGSPTIPAANKEDTSRSEISAENCRALVYTINPTLPVPQRFPARRSAALRRPVTDNTHRLNTFTEFIQAFPVHARANLQPFHAFCHDPKPTFRALWSRADRWLINNLHPELPLDRVYEQ
ncbi:uncharacterized protein KY384_008014 [Bacidia gigantensis]|uniref:uncharacterized protein n=1 Tax=Bacidia gigantensis TaxID=2732470 RepID=UPI001D05AD5E|nr:uncharacterized protein KY384_008014 [Bacidia gigantensis]KAG8527270.1 hypothetical protein KY384_008014 [Bacidia gigantensis]